MSSADADARYFFLSYPRLPPLPPVPGADVTDPPDEWVRAFHHDLNAAVTAAAPAPPLRPGFLDDGVSSADEPMAALVEALSSAAAFVPLLSPDYLRRSWPGREWASFERRMERAGVADPLQRFAPVLWVPMAAGEQPPGLAMALSLAPGAAATPYAENGLRALLRLSRYRGIYLRIVREIAARVVSLAAESPLTPSPAQHPRDADSELGGEARGPVFAIAVAASGGTHETSAAQYATLAAERLGFMVVRPEVGKPGVFQRAPGVLLIDPGDLAGAKTRSELRMLVGELPSWVLPVIAGDGSDDRETADIVTLLEKAYDWSAYRSDAVRWGLRGMASLQEFLQLMPFIISHAEREYLRHRPIQRSASGSAFRPRLVGGHGSAPLPVEENPGV